MSKRKIFLDANLFGNDAGEDESTDRLKDYFLTTPEQDIFLSKDNKLNFVRSRKGMGKSALLCYTASAISVENPDDIVINIKASELEVDTQSSFTNAMGYVNMWQQAMCSRINNEIGKKLKLGISDDKMSVIEMAEINGFKGKNIVGALLDRVKIHEDKFKIEKTNVEINHSELLKRIQSSQDCNVWLLIDDIDATYIDSEHNRLFISTFFSACRLLTQNIKGLNIRASVRTDVWTLLAATDESLDKCEQYMYDLKWSTKQTGQILLNKIKVYLAYCSDPNETNQYDKPDDVYKNVFKSTFQWGNNRVNPLRVIHILSAGRPRWASQLCKIAAKDAYNKEHSMIGINNINFAMTDYGRKRLSDLQKEHAHQCSRISEIIESFRNGASEYRYDELINHINTKILLNISDIIVDLSIVNNAIDIARFLYRIGFITLRNNEFNKAEGFTHYEEAPDILSETNIDHNSLWIVHPAYRTALNIR